MDNYLSNKLKNISFISILLVVYLHSFNLKVINDNSINISSIIQQFISNGVTRIAVPLFFLTSGYLFFINFQPTFDCYISKCRKRFNSLVIPFIFWSMLGIIFYFTMQMLPLTRTFFTRELIKNYSFLKLLDTLLLNPIPYQLWFVIELIKYTALSPLIYILAKRLNYYLIGTMFLLWFFSANLVIFDVEGLLFFTLGAILAIKNVNFNRFKYRNRYMCNVGIFVWMSLLVISTFLFFFNIPIHVYIRKINIVIGILISWLLYDSYMLNRIGILKGSSYTFFIYASHEPILTIVKKVLFKVLTISVGTSLVIFVISPIITIYLCIYIAKILKRKTPRFYKMITGGRND